MNTNHHLPLELRMSVRTWFTTLLLAIAIIGCGGGDTPVEQQLAKLRADRAAIDEKISALEKLLATKPAKAELVPVTAFDVTAAPFAHVIDVKGTVESRTTVTVTPKMAGTITTLNVANGQSVSKGALLVELDNAMIRAGVEEVRTQLDLAVTLYEKQKRIYEAKAGSEVQYLTAKTQKEALERRLASLNEQLEMTRIYAPVAGVVENLTPRLGEMAMPGMPMFTIVNTADMRVVTDLSEVYVKDVDRGDRVKIIFPEIGDSVATSIMHAARNVNPLSRTFRVEMPVRPVPASLRPNMTARVMITDKTIPNAIAVPLACIVRDGADSYVWLIGSD
ncbi:MAG: efflux RND transporter periplasmic adaptor subunit, partial [Candidatus Kapabacteria bacterium]|nr:efflux RND transporter periplasmic adaptor subunit [Candidatus Kapabacteria bacterium]